MDSTGRRNTLISKHREGVLQMKYRKRIYYTDAQKALMWDRWQKGDSMHDIGKLFDRGHSSVHKVLNTEGGIRPRFRTRNACSLSLAERETI